MDGYERVAAVDDIPDGSGQTVWAGAEEIALFNSQGAFYAISNICPHRGAPLSEGFIEGERVLCPWHCFDFHLRSGECGMVPGMRVKAYELKVEDGEIFVRVK